MSFAAHVFDSVEAALSDAFAYHDALDTFLLRSGVSRSILDAARRRAEEQNKRSGRYLKASKRIVVKEVLLDLGQAGDVGDRIIAEIITGLCNGHFGDATDSAKLAIDRLKKQRVVEHREAEARRQEHRDKLRAQERELEKLKDERDAARDRFKLAFLNLCNNPDAQARGYLLETFLNDFFEFEKLSPRGSFKIAGEQIDGSFAWSGRTHLVEAKWVNDPVASSGFSGLMYKIEGKTADTRGFFISINGYSQEAIKGLKGKGALRFVCVDGAHLMRCLGQGPSMPQLLDIVWRYASETGEAYLPVGSSHFAEREKWTLSRN